MFDGSDTISVSTPASSIAARTLARRAAYSASVKTGDWAGLMVGGLVTLTLGS